MARLPESLRPCFWEVDFERLDLAERKAYILERVLEHGDDPAIRWLLRSFSDEDIAEAVRTSRALSPNTAHLWALALKIPLEDIACISRPSPILPGRS
ncbi:MAG: hypothetical protein HY721_16795 [Planctomycetes bacterium]|nr:hypothetical protein [Planctomycetota bacterium]